ncbi:ribonuclease P protein component [Allopseudospirillum japonicum]|uniref:Ribonuclease P protein component n=2 Tax=Allopseudospirillum japonicum TaxID=64971 RepID=A0A1H6TPT8_9GAMM|nr:ribonuclease P protein component [Allopseudospirillum japonicum]
MTMPVVTYPFQPCQRLTKAAAYSRVFEQTQFKAFCSGILLLATPAAASGGCLNPQTKARLGLVIAKKHVRHAVRRNRLKRLIRNSFRLHQHQLPPLDIIALAVRGAGEIEDAKLQQQLVQAWARLAKQARQQQKTQRAQDAGSVK